MSSCGAASFYDLMSTRARWIVHGVSGAIGVFAHAAARLGLRRLSPTAKAVSLLLSSLQKGIWSGIIALGKYLFG